MSRLEENIADKIYTLLDEAVRESQQNNYAKSLSLMEDAWETLPAPKYEFPESSIIMFNLINASIRLDDLEKAKTYAETLYQCDPNSFDNGDKDFLNGKVLFELNQLDKARELFTLADKKSGGLCFEHHDPKYLQFYDKGDGQLDNATYEQIKTLCSAGDNHFNQQEYLKAIQTYNEALALVPHPKNNWSTSIWVFVALGDTYYTLKDFETALDYFYRAYNIDAPSDNPFIHLRMGQCYYEIGDFKKADNFLLSAYMLEGEDIFRGETFFFNFLKSRVDLELKER